MRLILLGAPGAGKGTQANFIKNRYNIPQISTGDMLRTAITIKNKIGVQVKKIMDKGGLVSDNIIIKLVKERLKKEDCLHGYLFDGFPRTIPQAKAIREANIKIDYILEINIQDDVIIERVTGRLIHPASGRIYHSKYNPPKFIGKDNITHEDLIQRDDDKEVIVRHRLKIYHEQTKPLIEYYNTLAKSQHSNVPKYYKICGNGSIYQVQENILSVLSKNIKLL